MKKRNRLGPCRVAIILMVILLALAAAIYYFFFLNRPGKSYPYWMKEEGSVRLATLNVNGFRSLSSANLTGEFLLNTLRTNEVDILLMQEYRSVWKFEEADFRSIFSELYPYIIVDGEQVVLSRYPVVDHRLYDFDFSPDSFASNVISGPDGREINLISVHLQTTGLFFFAKGTSKSSTLPIILQTMRENRKARIAQALQVRSVVEASQYPVLLAGDFNSLPLTRVYSKIRRAGLTDAFLEKGSGSGSTYRALKDFLRIDYIMPDKNFDCLDCKVSQDFLSDHRMVLSTLRLRR